MPKHIRVLTIIFDAEIAPHEVPLFRGAVIRTIGDDADVLYHNHEGDNAYRQRYPLIQYKRLSGKASIVSIEEGINAIQSFLQSDDATVMLGHREISLTVKEVIQSETVIGLSDTMNCYNIKNWLALNPDNVKKYRRASGIKERAELLEQVLTGNILSMCKGQDYYLEDELQVSITDYKERKSEYVKGMQMLSFDAEFKSNILLPQYIGLGKYASKGHGVITKKM